MNKHLHRLVFSRVLGACIAVAETSASTGKSASGERRGSRSVAGASSALGLVLVALGAHAQSANGAGGAGSLITGVAPRPSLQSGNVLPTGGVVVKGSGTIEVSGADMTVNQASQRLVANWQSFSIGAGNSVRFVQPSSSSVALNRVTGDDASRIFGSLTANGHVYLENANGVYFAPGAQVSVGSLLATTLHVDDDQFMQGNLRLSGGNTTLGEVSNGGSIITAPGGYVVLAGPVVSNTGAIVTPGGTTALVAANAVNVDPTGSGLLNISVPVAAVNASLEQSGSITADGGSVQLAAAATDAALRTVMQVGGVVRARSIENRDGSIVLSGGSNGIVAVTGQLDASGGSGMSGGTIEVLGDRVGLLGQAHLDASGGTGGGTVLVGGNRQGLGPEQNATNTYVGNGVVIDASVNDRGNGGQVVVWADNQTSYAGQINARGGAQGGDGGNVEVSGKGALDFQGGVDLSSPHGENGALLLDPTSITIGTIANVDGTAGDDLATRNLQASDYAGLVSQIKATTVATLLSTGNVSLAALNAISVTAPLAVPAGGSPSTLTLSATDIAFNAAVTLNNSSLAATASNSITNDAAVTSLNSIALTARTISINGLLGANTMSLLTNAGTGGSVAEQSAGAGLINANSLTIGGASGFPGPDSADLSFANNKIGSLSINANAADITVANDPGVPLVVSGAVPGAFQLTAMNTDITQPGGVLGALALGSFTVTTTGSGNTTLTNPANSLSSFAFDAAGNVNVVSSTGLNANGSSTGDVTLAALGGNFSLSGTISAANVDISGIGFVNDTYYYSPSFTLPAGGRFVIHSSDYTQDNFGSLGFGVASDSINYIVYGGYTGTAPGTGNGLFTNQTGSIAPPVADNPPISKVYDGTPNFNYTQTGTTTAGTLNAASPVALTLSDYTINGTGAFADKNAGTNKQLSVASSNDTSAVAPSYNGAVLYGLQFAGYTRAAGAHVAGTPGNAVSQITPKPITASGIDGIDRVYDGTTGVGLNAAGASLTGVVSGDTVSVAATSATGTLANKNVGVNKAVSITGLTLTGADQGNYTVSDASGATATITARSITSTGFTGVSRVYDGTTAVAVDGAGATLTGVIGGDTVGIAGGATGTVADKNVGTAKPVAVTGVALNGADAGNYTVTDASAATANITPRPLTSTGVTGVDRTYDASTVVAVSTSGATLVNAVAGDNVSLVGSGASGTIADKNVGTAKPVTVGGLALGGSDAGNYTLTGTSGATVDITPLAVQATGITAVNRPVDGSTDVGLNTSGAGVAGVLPGDTVGVDASGAVGSVATPAPGEAKPVTVTGIVLTGADSIDYSVSPTPIAPGGGPLTVRILSAAQSRFDDIRFKEYLQGVADAQEPFRRAMLEALLSGFGKENIRKQLQRGLVYETGLAPPAVDIIDSAKAPASCDATSGLRCGQ